MGPKANWFPVAVPTTLPFPTFAAHADLESVGGNYGLAIDLTEATPGRGRVKRGGMA